MTLDEFCRRAANLRRDTSSGRPMPYKPVLLAAVVMLIHKGTITTRHVFLDGGLKSAFDQILQLLFPDWPFKAKVAYPFRHLENDGIWKLEPHQGAAAGLLRARADHREAWEILRHVSCASLDENVFAALASGRDAQLRVLKSLWEMDGMPLDAARKLLSLLFEPEYESTGALRASDSGPFTERAFEEYLERNWQRTPFAPMGIALSSTAVSGLPGRQVLTQVSSIDLLGFQRARKTWWVFELKRGKPSDAVVGQTSRYMGWIAAEREGRGEGVVGAVLAERTDARLRYAVKANPALSLWTYDRSFALQRVA